MFANLANAEGNACMYQRVIPDDAGPEATITFWLDVLETTVDLYERNEDSCTVNGISCPYQYGVYRQEGK